MPRFVVNSALPSSFRDHPEAKGVVRECDIKLTPRARLAAKVLVFETPSHLRRFWTRALAKPDLGRGCLGAVTSLSGLSTWDGEKARPPRMFGDRRYFCVIGLVRGHLSMEIICHEAVHAGFAYHNRVARSPFAGPDELDEERVAYPAGALAAEINRWLHKHGLYENERS